MVPSEKGPSKELVDVFYEEHMNSYKVFSQSYEWSFIAKNDLDRFYTTHMVRVMGGDLYISSNVSHNNAEVGTEII
ncbi:hypothetical protein HCN44_009090 [Aphidius gifuensis]|uniref:Uncharacterized protein n=1 Tax=Aphidius gifuensis TaxID=684658 RepID=A0A834XNR9_APHGI|nr:hypothetical protein HCN44_009090 [Aphidius gifuensis]